MQMGYLMKQFILLQQAKAQVIRFIPPRYFKMSETKQSLLEDQLEKSPGKLVMDTFYAISDDGCAVTARDIVRYLRAKFGESWRQGTLHNKVFATYTNFVRTLPVALGQLTDLFLIQGLLMYQPTANYD